MGGMWSIKHGTLDHVVELRFKHQRHHSWFDANLRGMCLCEQYASTLLSAKQRSQVVLCTASKFKNAFVS